MDVRARMILSVMRAVPGAEQVILAGGAVRDTYFNLEPKDYDFFIPSLVFPEVLRVVVEEAAKALDKNPIFEGGKKKSKYAYTGLTPTFDSVYDTKEDFFSGKSKKGYKDSPVADVVNVRYEGIDCQLMSVPPSTKDFIQGVIDRFDFGINMVYYEGSTIIRDTDAFMKDVTERTITLYNPKSIESLPNHLVKFQRISEKLKGVWVFKCPGLRIEKNDEEDKEANFSSIPKVDIYEDFRPRGGHVGAGPVVRAALDRFERQAGHHQFEPQIMPAWDVNAALNIPQGLQPDGRNHPWPVLGGAVVGGPMGGGMGVPAAQPQPIPMGDWNFVNDLEDDQPDINDDF